MIFGKAKTNASVEEFTVKYRAMQFTGDNFDSIKEFVGKNAFSFQNNGFLAGIEFDRNSITPLQRNYWVINYGKTWEVVSDSQVKRFKGK